MKGNANMNNITLEAIRSNPQLLANLRTQARLARSVCAHRILAGLYTRLKWVLEEIRGIHVSGRPAQG